MSTPLKTDDKTTIAPEVLSTIASLTTLQVPGVSRLSTTPISHVKGLFKPRQHTQGVTLEVKDDSVFVEIYVIMESDVNIQEVGREIQHRVARAISEMVGMKVGRINIHVEDIDFPSESEASQS